MDTLEINPADLSQQSDEVKTEIVKKTVYDDLIKKVNAIQANDTSNLVNKTGYDT